MTSSEILPPSLYEIFLASEGVSTDSRTLRKGELFFALSGEHFDGNQFAHLALEKGAIATVVSDPLIASQEKRCLYVPDTRTTLGLLASQHRTKLGIPLLLITGTNGKTTTKELIATVLRKKFSVLATKGNLNNAIGLPLTLLQLTPSHQLAVIEAGASAEGEIAYLSQLAKPDYGLITNIGKAHLEGFGSPEGVIRAKRELYSYIASHHGKLFVNGDDSLLLELSNGIERITYGTSEGATHRGELLEKNSTMGMCFQLIGEPQNSLVTTQLVGNYNLSNALASVAVGRYFGISDEEIVSAIASFRPTNHRSQLVEKSPLGNRLVLDIYNANPSSMHIAVASFASYCTNGQQRIFVLGDMLELGEASPKEHREMLRIVEDLTKEHGGKAIFVGREFAHAAEGHTSDQTIFFETTSQLASYLQKHPIKDSVLLLKASRGLHFESLLPYI